MYPVDLPTTVTQARDFEAAELEANYAQAVNLVINGSSDLDSKLKQIKMPIISRISHIYPHQPIHSDNKKCVHATIVKDKDTYKLTSTLLPTNNITANISTANILNFSLLTTGHLSTAATNNVSATATNNISTNHSINTTTKPCSDNIRKPQIKSCLKLEIGDSCPSTDFQLINPTIRVNPNSQNYLSLLVIPEDATSNNPESYQPPTILTNNIPPATVINNESLTAIFPFELEAPLTTPLFSRAALEEKPITTMYTDAKVDSHLIKLILNSRLAGSIIIQQLMNQLGRKVDRAASTRIITTDGATKTPISEIDNFSFEISGLITPIKVLVMEATQYQALVGNNWLSKTNANGQHVRTPAIYGHFKAPSRKELLIELEEKKEKPIWKAYQVLWADVDHNELSPILTWDNNNNGKEKQKEEST
ncbi:hypothetical protein G9A89_021922 [Geosiphon pyriformis]|nr:hypothetical protein G9A89_021922 [Geosiphon pyriformis]